MKRTPKISVIVPIYNVEQYISECLDSLINQTLRDIEIICVDDCGSDKSMDIVQEYAAKDNRIKIVKHEKNSGLSASRNTGLENSSAPYIMCCDSDDFYTPNMCEVMLNTITQTGADIAMCGINIIYEADHHLKDSDDEYYRIKFSGIQDVSDEIIGKCDVSSWNKIYRREFLDKHEIRWPTGLKYEDAYFFNAYMVWAKKIAFITDKLYCYRRRPGSIMNKTFEKTNNYAIDHLKIAFKLYDYFNKYDLCNEQSDNFWKNMFIPYLNFSIWNTNDKKSITEIQKLASDFVKKNYKYGVTDLTIDKTIKQIKNKTYMKTKTFCFGACSLKQTMEKTVFRIFGTPVYNIHTGRNRYEHFLFGIHIFNTHFDEGKNINFRIPKINEQNIDNTNLLSELSKLSEFTYIPNPGNIGDALIAYTTMRFFDKNNIEYKIYNGQNDKHIVYGGGGIWTSDYQQHWIKFLDIFKNAERIVILPSSFNNCEELINILDDRFTIFCREKQSYDYLISKNTSANIILDHDMAFRLTDDMLNREMVLTEPEYLLLNKLRTTKINNTTYFTRRDCESAGDYKHDIDISLYSWCWEQSDCRSVQFLSLLMLETVARAKTIVTDRLHVGISGLLTGKKTYLLDNTYKKISNVYEHTIKSRNKKVKFGLPNTEK